LANLGTIQNTGSAADGADPDGDGWTNSDERPAGTDPNDRASALKIDQIQASGDDMVITFKTVSGKTYAIMSRFKPRAELVGGGADAGAAAGEHPWRRRRAQTSPVP